MQEKQAQLRDAVVAWLADLDSPVDYTQLSQRFWALTNLGEVEDVESQCITWLNSNAKYPIFTIKGVPQYAHRIAVRIGLGTLSPRSVPGGMTVDHVRERGCDGPGCVNPYHLEVVSQATNSGRNRNMNIFT